MISSSITLEELLTRKFLFGKLITYPLLLKKDFILVLNLKPIHTECIEFTIDFSRFRNRTILVRKVIVASYKVQIMLLHVEFSKSISKRVCKKNPEAQTWHQHLCLTVYIILFGIHTNNKYVDLVLICFKWSGGHLWFAVKFLVFNLIRNYSKKYQ